MTLLWAIITMVVVFLLSEPVSPKWKSGFMYKSRMVLYGLIIAYPLFLGVGPLIGEKIKEIKEEQERQERLEQKKASKSTEVKENGQIPGFSSCLKTDTWSDDPNENISYCCKQVGGTLRDGIMMKTCEK